MKHYFCALLMAACLFCAFNARALPLYGSWSGVLDAGATKLRIIFNISDQGGALHATMDSPDQGAKDIPVTRIVQSGDSLTVSLGPITYRGRIAGDSIIEGVFIQGMQIPLTLHRTAQAARRRPQTPQPPYPYRAEEVSFHSQDGSITYGATITAPDDTRLHPAVLLITGSGQQNRNEEIAGHQPFAVLADYLTRRGYIVLRVDDRGTGSTTGNVATATTLDFAGDAGAALDYLKSRTEVDKKKLGLLGHSEGGMIATMLASTRKDLAFIITLAGPGIANITLMKEQNNAILEKNDIGHEAREAYLKLYSTIMAIATDRQAPPDLTPPIDKAVTTWRINTPDSIVVQTTGIRDEAAQHRFAAAFAQQAGLPWFRYFIAYDPAPLIRKLTCKVLALNGSKDIQVVAGSNLAGWRTALKSSTAKNYKVAEMAGLNHLFQQCTRCDVAEYGELEQTIAPEALSAIGEWLDKEVK